METFGGTAGDGHCVFPFIFKGAKYTYCYKESFIPWCATTSSYDKDEKWGYCAGMSV
jgi:hypothetical protein